MDSNALNASQRQAVTALAGPVLVLAGAGTGKTRVVTQRIAYLIRHGVPPHRILGVTFTNKAADEMRLRIRACLPRARGSRSPAGKPTSGPLICTFHSYCVRVLRRHAQRAGYPQDFRILDRGDQEAAARSALRDLRVSEQRLAPGQVVYLISRWKSAGIGPEQAIDLADDDDALAAAAYRRYQASNKAAGCVDFDDLLLMADDLFSRFDDIRSAEAARFDHLLVDEYQDTNRLQYRLAGALAARHRNLFVVGDDDQSIYGWRGAEIDHILGFARDWPEATVIRLEKNYRSSASILAAANRLIGFNVGRHAKTLLPTRGAGPPPQVLQCADESREAADVVGHLKARLTEPGRQPRDFAVLFRTNEQTRPFELELRKAGLPYVVVGGYSFYDRKEVKDIVALIELAIDPENEPALRRMINVPPRGLGPKAVEILSGGAAERGMSLWKALHLPAEAMPLAPSAWRGARALCDMLDRAQAALQTAPGKLADAVASLVQISRYREEIERLYDDPIQRDARWANVEQIVNSAALYAEQHATGSARDFLDQLLLKQQDSEDEKERSLQRNAVVLITLHSAKGLEFPEVYLAGLEEGILPHHRSISSGPSAVEEERRLCYVGVTRAQQRLTLALALGRMKWGKRRATIPSRFLFELCGKTGNPKYRAAIEGLAPDAQKKPAAGKTKSNTDPR